jgi:hypothetical protein
LSIIWDAHHPGVLYGSPGHLLDADAVQVGLEHAHGAAVRDDHHVSVDVRQPGVRSMSMSDEGRQGVTEPRGPRVQVAHRLPAVGPGVRVGDLAGVQAGHVRADGRRRAALEGAEAPLAQPGVGEDRQAEDLADRRGGLQGAAQVAGVDGADGPAAEPLGGLGRLAQAPGGKLRFVVVALG